MKLTSDQARIHLEVAKNFADIAGVKAEGREDNLLRAIDAYKKALEYFTIQKNKIEFSRIQNNLGIAYSDMAGVRDKEENLVLAIQAYNNALKIRTLDAFPVDYAGTKLNLGNVYLIQGKIKESVECYKEALEIYEKEGIQEYIRTLKVKIEELTKNV